MRLEYDWAKNPEDENRQQLGTAAWTQAKIAGEDAAERKEQDAKAPPFAPFYWGVREHQDGAIGPKKVVNRVRELIEASVPKFMDRANARALFDHAEFWMGAQGTGARAHMDSHCISTLSVVLKGARRWRIGPVPRLPKGAGRSKNGEVVFDDGVAYRMGWTPMFEFVAQEGEAVLFPPGWIHETLNEAEGCTVALTTQFALPKPVRYYRNYYNRLRRVGDLHPCWREMMRWPSLGGKPPKPSAAKAVAEGLFEGRNGSLSSEETAFYDLDSDGKVSREEFVDTFSAWAATEAAIRSEKPTQALEGDMSLEPDRRSEEL